MKIKRLKLRNFRNFKNLDLSFSTDKDKKITIILGDNTFGKTTLVKSFIWCLYRENTFPTKTLLNKDVADFLPSGQSATVSAELTLEHEGFEYVIQTSETYEKARTTLSITKPAATIIYKRDLNSISPDTSEAFPAKVENEINNILHKDLKDYFFFDGETNTIEKFGEKAQLQKAVINLMHLNETEIINEYFNTTRGPIMTTLRGELDTNDNSSDILKNINIELREEQEHEFKLEKSISDNLKVIEGLSHQRKECDDIISENIETKKYQDQKLELEKKIDGLKKQISPSFNNMIKGINYGDALLNTLFAQAYTKFKLEDKLSSTSFNDKNSYIGITEEAVNRLIENGECICGAKIENGNDAYRHLVKAKEHMEPRNYGGYVRSFKSTEGSNASTAKTIASNIRGNALSIINLYSDIEDNNETLRVVKQNITSDIDVGSYQRKLDQIDKRIEFLKGENSTSDRERGDCENRIKDLEKRQDTEATKNEKNAFTQKCISYVTRIYEITSNDISNANEKIRADLQEEVQKIFNSMYTGHRDIVINPNFKVNKEDLDPSTGFSTVLNYSFVLGLMELAKKSATEHRYGGKAYDSVEIPVPEYPLVLDAPFSSTDSEHIKNICSIMPNYCNQIIMVLMPKDYNYAYNSIKGKIGKIFQIEKKDETNSVIEEV